jgi:hypothetical protein
VQFFKLDNSIVEGGELYPKPLNFPIVLYRLPTPLGSHGRPPVMRHAFVNDVCGYKMEPLISIAANYLKRHSIGPLMTLLVPGYVLRCSPTSGHVQRKGHPSSPAAQSWGKSLGP